MNKTEFLTNEQIEGIKKIDKWLKDNQNDDLIGITHKSREILEKILSKGYYRDIEREFLNELRRQYLEDKQK